MSSISRSLLASLTAVLLAVTGLAGITVPAQANGVSTAIAAENISPSKAPTAGGQQITAIIPSADLFGTAPYTAAVVYGGTDGGGGNAGTSVSVSDTTSGIEVVSTTPAGLSAGENEIYITLTDSAGTPATKSFKGSIEVADPQINGYVTGSAVRGLEAGGTPVSVYGENFEAIVPGFSIGVGGLTASAITVLSDTEISFETPTGTAGAQNITAADLAGVIPTNGLTFLYYNSPQIQLVTPDAGFIDGGEPVILKGFGFDLFDEANLDIQLAGKSATDVVVVSDELITFNTPLNNSAGSTPLVLDDGSFSISGLSFTFSSVTLDAVTPAFGTASGGDIIEISGFGFENLSNPSVTIGSFDASPVTYDAERKTFLVTTPTRSTSDRTVGPSQILLSGDVSGSAITTPTGDEVYFNYIPKLDVATASANAKELTDAELPFILTPRSEGKAVTITNEEFLGAPNKVVGTETWTTSRTYTDRNFDEGLQSTGAESSRVVTGEGTYRVTEDQDTGAISLYSSMNCGDVWPTDTPGDDLNISPTTGLESYCSVFGPDIISEPFYASAGDSLTFQYSAQGTGDNYEIYAYLVETTGLVAPVTQTRENSEIIHHEVGKSTPGSDEGGFVNLVTTIPSTGFFYFRFVNGTYDESGGYALGATMILDPNIIVGQQNEITFPAIADQSGVNEGSTVQASLTALSGASVQVVSNNSNVCTVSTEYNAATTITTATVTLVDTGDCSLSASSQAVGLFAPAATVSRVFNISNLVKAPAAITNLGITEFKDGTASLSWTAPNPQGSPITDYEIQYSVDDGASWITVTDGVSTATTYDVTGLDISVQTKFRVAAKNANGPGNYSNVVESLAITLAERESMTSVNLEWTGPATVFGSAVTDYKIEYSFKDEPYVVFDDGVGTDTTPEVTDLKPGGEYRFKITALNSSQSGIVTISDPVNLPAGFGAPVPFPGPVVTSIGGQSSMPFITESGEELTAGGLGLGVVVSGTIDGKDAQLELTADGGFRFTVPAGLLPGTYSLFTTTASGEIIEHVEAVIIPGAFNPAGCDAGSSVWTKRISETQAKVYMKCPVVGDTYSFSVQEDGVGEYETRLTRTLQSEDSDEQIFNSVGRYIVRTVELQEKTRIRIFVNGERVWQVVYNRGSFG